MMHLFSSLELGLSQSRAALFSSPPADSTMLLSPEPDAMVAVVFLYCQAQTHALCQQLIATDKFDRVYDVSDEDHYFSLLDVMPTAVSFLPARSRILSNSHRDWIAVGDNNTDALIAFSSRAWGFVSHDADTDEIATALKRVEQRHMCRQRNATHNSLTRGLSKQLGVSEAALLASLKRQYADRSKPHSIGLKTEHGWRSIELESLFWVEAAGDYMCIHLGAESVVVRTTLTDLIDKLNDSRFVKASRSVLVNTDFVSSLEQTHTGVNFIILSDGTRLKISRRYFAEYWRHWQKPARP